MLLGKSKRMAWKIKTKKYFCSKLKHCFLLHSFCGCRYKWNTLLKHNCNPDARKVLRYTFFEISKLQLAQKKLRQIEVTILHIVLQVVTCVALLLCGWKMVLLWTVNPCSLLLFKTGSAEDYTCNKQKRCWNKSCINCSSWFMFTALWNALVQKTWNNFPRVPGCWY